MFFNLRELNPRERAVKDRRLVDMQQAPFVQFNQIVQAEFPIVISQAAYQQLVQLPGEQFDKAEVPANFRWGVLFLAFMEAFQCREDDPDVGEFDINVLMPGGLQVPKTVKVLSNRDENGFTFMLPGEEWDAVYGTASRH
jgi:hypothetical protein